MKLQGLPRERPALLVCDREFRLPVAQSIIETLRAIRPDFRILAPAPTVRDAMFNQWCIFLHTVAQRGAAAGNYQPLRRAVSWLKEGGLLVVFPAGEFSQWAGDNMFSIGPRWSDTCARLAILTGALTIPMAPIENAAGAASVHFGKPIGATTLKAMAALRDATEYVRVCAERIDPMRPRRERLVPRLAAS
jgi:hypothetical protein